MQLESQIIISASSKWVFECIANPVYKTKWMKNMVGSTFDYSAIVLGGSHNNYFKEAMTEGKSFRSRQVELISFKQGESFEIKYLHKSHAVLFRYDIKSIGNFTLLTITANIRNNSFLRKVTHFIASETTRKEIRIQLEAIQLFAEDHTYNS